MVLGIFATRNAHPLVSDGERHKLLERLVAVDPVTGLRETTAWLQGLTQESGVDFAVRALIIRQLEDCAQPHAEAANRQYLTMAHLSEDEDLQLWRTSRDYFAQLGAAYHVALQQLVTEGARAEVGPTERARFLVRLMRAYGSRLKWDQYRYWPASEALWQIVGGAWLHGRDAGVATRFVSAYHGERAQSSVEQEYLRLLVFQISAMDSLLPFEVEIAERFIAGVLPKFRLSAVREADCGFVVEPGERRPPARLREPVAAAEGACYFGTAAALAELERMRAQIARTETPEVLRPLRYRSARIVLPVLRHLVAYWSAARSARSHDRYRVHGQLAVVDGLAAVHSRLSGIEDQFPGVLWRVEDVSFSGLRVQLPAAEAPLRIGTLLGYHPDLGEHWLVGVVRRYVRESELAAAAGIETLSKSALPLQLAGNGQPALLLDAPDAGEIVRIVLPGLAFQPGFALDANLLGEALRLEPVALLERGVEFDLARYRVLPEGR